MKKTIKYLSIGFTSVMAFAACSDQFLQDKKNSDNVNTDIYNYYSGCQGRVDDVYGWCLPTVSEQTWKYPSMGSNDIAARSTEEYTNFSDFVEPQKELSSMSSKENNVPDYFMGTQNNIQEAVYGRIRNINDAMQGIEGGTLSQAEKNLLLGQLHFFRAWCYFNIVKWYGGVPIVEGTPAPEEGIFFPRQSAKACFDYIINDLNTAAEMLKGKIWSGSDYGRVTSGTALALKGRVLTWWCSPLFNRKGDAIRYQQAFETMKKDLTEIDACGYGLYKSGADVNGSDFANQFLVAGNNPEAVFFTLYNKVASDDGLDNQKNNSWERAIRPSNTGGGGKNPSKMIVKMFPMKDGKIPAGTGTYNLLTASQYTYDEDAPFMNRDPRFYRTFAFPGFRWAYSGDPTQRDGHNPSYDQGKNYILWSYVWYTDMDSQGNPESGDKYASDNLGSSGGIYVRKKSDDFDINLSPLYAYSPTATKGAGPFFSGATLIELRYAEVLLNLAEVACGAGDMNYAVERLKDIRKRVGYTGDCGLQGDLTGNQAACMSAILYERQIEFAYEGKRFDDMRRWMLFDGGELKDNEGNSIANIPDTWKLSGLWGTNTCNWLGFAKFNGQRRERIEFRTKVISGKQWNDDPILKDALDAAAQTYTDEYNAAHPEATGRDKMTVKKARQLMVCYEKAMETRDVTVDLRSTDLDTELQNMKTWYSNNLVTTEKKGDARQQEQDLYIDFRPKYYFLGFSSGTSMANKALPQTIGWQDYNKAGAMGTFDPLAE